MASATARGSRPSTWSPPPPTTSAVTLEPSLATEVGPALRERGAGDEPRVGSGRLFGKPHARTGVDDAVGTPERRQPPIGREHDVAVEELGRRRRLDPLELVHVAQPS